MCHGGALFPEVFKDKASPQYPTAAMQNTQRPARGACSTQHLAEQQLGLGSDSSGGWSAVCGAYSASFQRLRLPGSGGAGPCFFPGMPVKDP